ncbi:uncharacterized protein LOC129785304 isoform X2 [Falco peregrinus]|uniref:uncharacterized protein LOC129785304 isoform X2 n=1 Tax=Falco peregrinus TaxID=8954 RepID=UPI002478F0BE|nr:uncharacterized protein LOC129785304 isoform X2 [Falco peregrinus]
MGTPGRFPVRENGLPKGHGGGHPACTRAAALSSAAPNTRLLLCQGTRQAGAEADADARVRYCIPTWPCAAPPAPAEPAPPAKPAPTKPAPTKPAPAKPAPTKPAPAKPAPAKPAPTKPAPAKPAPAKPAPTKPAPAKPAPAKPAPAAAAGGTAAEGEEHPGVPLSPLLQQPCLLLTHFWPASPHEAQHLPPPCRVFPFFFSVKRALSYQNPSSRGVRYSSPAFIYWNCTASNKHTFPAAEQRRRCPQRSRGPGSTRSPLPAVRARSRALGLEAPSPQPPEPAPARGRESTGAGGGPGHRLRRDELSVSRDGNASHRAPHVDASPALPPGLHQCGSVPGSVPPTPTGGMLNPCPWDSALRFPRFPFYRHLTTRV